MKVNKSMFGTKKEAVEFAAHMVAQFWLVSANNIIERGETPTAISKPLEMGVPYGQQLARGEMDQDIYNRFRHWMDSETIYSYAKQEARERLQRGEFPRVAAFDFSPQLRRAA
jgi:hypothetical protein